MSPGSRRLRGLALVACLVFPSCLTARLWDGPDPVLVVPRNATIVDVVDIRGTVGESPQDTRVELLLSTDPSDPVAHTRNWTTEDPGRVTLRPWLFDPSWLPGCPGFETDTWDVSIFGFDGLASRDSFNARVTMNGTAPASALGEWLRETPRPEHAFGIGLIHNDWETQALDGLLEHPWSELLGGPEASATPVAWLDDAGRLLDRAPLHADARDFTLVARFRSRTGEVRYAKFPATLLTAARGQELERTADGSIAWRYSSIWTANNRTTKSDLPQLALGRVGPERVYYEFGREAVEARDPVPVWVKVLATPVTFAIDSVYEIAMLSPPLRRLRDFFLGRKPPDEEPGRRGQ